MSSYRPTIGLETHVQLATRTKLFCGCENRFGAPPNTLVCPVCTGQPGVLPVLNANALQLGIRAALALGAEIAPFTKFDRKHYFYPDLPKGYQISQFDLPFSHGGGIALSDGTFVRLRRIHLEEDAGKGIHDRGDVTLVDLNRAGVPLIEIVTEPDVHSAAQAHEYLTLLKERLRFTGVSECDMEKGSLRCDANVSVHPEGAAGFGTRAEVKNLNSFAMVRRAIEYEIDRQSKLLDGGARVPQETRTWRDDAGRTETLRSKEEAHDYRYFPEPDLPPLTISPEEIARIRRDLPETADAMRARLRGALAESSGALHGTATANAVSGDVSAVASDASVKEKGPVINDEFIAALTSDPKIGPFFDQVAKECGDAKAAATWVVGDVNRVLNARGLAIADFPLKPAQVAGVIALVKSSRASVAAARQVFDALVAHPDSTAEAQLSALGLEQVSDRASIEAACREVLAANEKAVAEFRAGKEKALGALMGQTMKKMAGRANPAIVQATLRQILGAP